MRAYELYERRLEAIRSSKFQVIDDTGLLTMIRDLHKIDRDFSAYLPSREWLRLRDQVTSLKHDLIKELRTRGIPMSTIFTIA